MNLELIWYILVGILFTGYAILDGFDLGVGTVHLLAKKDEDRRVFLNAIGPVWDGNEVWLVTGGGALFAAFPVVYAAVFSGFYLAFVLLLFALIFRAVAIEFRSKEPWAWWRRMWDVAFSLGSIFSAFLIGVVMGNVVFGVPLDKEHEFASTLLGLFHPYSIFLGITIVALFAMHGTIYLAMKTEGELQDRVRGWIKPFIGIFVCCYIFFNMLTLIFVPHVLDWVRDRWYILFVLLADILAVMNIPREIHRGREFRAFLSSCVAMLLLMATFGLTYYPHMLYSFPNPENSLTIHNSASSPKTLGIMLTVAAIGIPLVLAYTVCIYWIFRGKTKLTSHSY